MEGAIDERMQTASDPAYRAASFFPICMVCEEHPFLHRSAALPRYLVSPARGLFFFSLPSHPAKWMSYQILFVQTDSSGGLGEKAVPCTYTLTNRIKMSRHKWNISLCFAVWSCQYHIDKLTGEHLQQVNLFFFSSCFTYLYLVMNIGTAGKKAFSYFLAGWNALCSSYRKMTRAVKSLSNSTAINKERRK